MVTVLEKLGVWVFDTLNLTDRLIEISIIKLVVIRE